MTADKIDFDSLTAKQREVLGFIAINEDGGHHPRVLESLVKKGLIVERVEKRSGGLGVKRYSVPIPVHVQWCEYCSINVGDHVDNDKRRIGGISCPEKCPECGAEMIQTSATYASCPKGHGRLYYAPIDGDAAVKDEREFKERMKRAFGPEQQPGK